MYVPLQFSVPRIENNFLFRQDDCKKKGILLIHK